MEVYAFGSITTVCHGHGDTSKEITLAKVSAYSDELAPVFTTFGKAESYRKNNPRYQSYKIFPLRIED